VTLVHAGALEDFGLSAEAFAGEGQRGAGAGGEVSLSRLRIDSFALAGTPIPIETINTLDLSYVVDALKQRTQISVHGIVGQDVLSRFDAVLVTQDQDLYLKLAERS
jgi:hypothetical protein